MAVLNNLLRSAQFYAINIARSQADEPSLIAWLEEHRDVVLAAEYMELSADVCLYDVCIFVSGFVTQDARHLLATNATIARRLGSQKRR